ITVCHFPPGRSKWNNIEHRLFSHITMNWRGRPLISHEVVVNLVGATKTRSGLKVHAHRDRAASCPTGLSVTDAQLAAVPLRPHQWHRDWNYTVAPRK
ncbi:MAG: ISAzo13-like element transposase-related protein, partial [Actinomycetota bacterium]